MITAPIIAIITIFCGSLIVFDPMTLSKRRMQAAKRAFESPRELVIINIHELNRLESAIRAKEEKIRMLQTSISEIQEAKVVNITHIDHVGTYVRQTDTVNNYISTQPQPHGDVQESNTVEEVSAEPVVHENLIFRNNLDGRPLDIERLFRWIDTQFLPLLTAKYEWFALWRVLKDASLLGSDMEQTSKFVEQMRLWYPEAPHTCSASEVNRYKRGYLGKEPFVTWDKGVFRNSMDDKQSMDGFKRLEELCRRLTDVLDCDQLKVR